MRILTATLGVALGTSVLLAAPASADQVKHNCVGNEVVRCANVEMSSAGVFNAHARVTDAAGGSGYSVQVVEVRLQYRYNGVWTNLRDTFPADTWAATQDVARTTSWSCGSSARKLVRAQAYTQWRRGGTVSGGWVTTPSAYICPRS